MIAITKLVPTLLASAITGLLLLLGGCATSVNSHENDKLDKGQAVVLLGLNSSIPLLGGAGCALCTTYQFGGRKDVYAYPVPIGSSFAISSISTYDNRFANAHSGSLKIDKAGIYYYGTIVGTSYDVKISRTVNPDMLLAARRKFGDRFEALPAIGFAWSEASRDSEFAVGGYQISGAVQSALAKYKGRDVMLTIGKLKAVPKPDIQCRMVGPLANPDFLPYEEYIRRALNLELSIAGMHDEKAQVTLLGDMSELSVKSVGDMYLRMGLRLISPNGTTISSRIHQPFKSNSPNGAVVCADAEDAVPAAVRALIESIVTSKEFEALMDNLAALRAVSK